MTQVAGRLAAKTPLRAGRTVEEAGEVMWTCSSPELDGLLVRTRGWTPERFGEFVSDSLVAALRPRRWDTGAAFGPPHLRRLTQDTAKGADTSFSYGFVVFLSNCTKYEPGSTLGGPDALMSPCVSAKVEIGNVTCTTVD
jgi:hypothetical protein